MMNKFKITRTILTIMLCISTAATLILFINYSYKKHESRKIFIKEARQENQSTMQSIENVFKKTEIIAKKTAQQISSGEIKYSQLKGKLRQLLIENPGLYGAGVSFLPYQYNKKQRLSSIYFTRPKGQIKLTPVTQNYMQKSTKNIDTNWFSIPMRIGPTWSEPYVNYIRKYLMTEYSVPIYRTNTTTRQKEKVGLLYLDLSLDTINQLLNNNKFCPTSICYMISKKGTFIINPFTNFTGLRSIFDYAKEHGAPKIATYARIALAGKAFHTEVKIPLSDQHYELFYMPMKKTGWALGIYIPKEKAFSTSQTTKQKQILIIALLMLSIILAIALKTQSYTGLPRGLWITSTSTAAGCLVVIVCILAIQPSVQKTIPSSVFMKSMVDRYITMHEKQLETPSQKNYKVPMGILLTNVDFTNANDALLSGFLWQVFKLDYKNSLKPGFILPQAENKIKTKEIFRTTHDNRTVIGWRFSAKLHLPQNALLFPFDSRKLSIVFIQKDFAKNVLLLPDLSAYYLINPKFLPGIGESAHFYEFTAKSSYFSYSHKPAKVSFNFAGEPPKNVSRLTFNLILTRNLLTPFINYFIIAIVVAIMMFTMVMVPKKTENDKDRVTTSTTRRLGFLASIIFIASLTHIRLRNDIAVVGVSYMETYYVIIYIIALITAIETILYTKFPNLSMIQYNDNLIFKVLYWPMVLVAILISTILYFGI